MLLFGGRRTERLGTPAGLRDGARRRSLVGAVLFVDMLGRARRGPHDSRDAVLLGAGGALQVDFGLQLDQLSMCFVLLITGVGSLIHIYSIGYMADDPEPPTVFRAT